ncbi:MAG: tetratricopeptide repeat protein [Magnetococcales bacterium]|nr:tetratricopeptide repeat protein [Magnetococcales bacterium]
MKWSLSRGSVSSAVWWSGMVLLIGLQAAPLQGAEGASQPGAEGEDKRLALFAAERTKQFGADNLLTATALLQLAEFRQVSGHDQEAEAPLTQAISILVQHHGPDHPEVAEARTKLARVKLRTGQFQAAHTLLESAATSLEKSLGADHLNTASARVNLARLLAAEPEQREIAAHLVETALPVLVKRLWPDNPRVAEAEMLLAKIRFSQGKMAEASQGVSKAQSMREHSLGPDHNLVAESLRERGRYLVAQGEFTAGDLFLRRSVEILERFNSDSTRLELAESLERLGESLLQQDRGQEAEPLFTRVLQLREKLLGKEHPTLVKILNDLALLRLSHNDFPNAKALFERSLAVTEKRLGADHLQVAFILSNLAQIELRQGHKEEAERLFERSGAAAERFFADDPLGLSDWFSRLGTLLHQDGAKEQAMVYFHRAETLLTTAYGKDHPKVVQIVQAMQTLQTLPTPAPARHATPPPLLQETKAPATLPPDLTRKTPLPELLITPTTITAIEPESLSKVTTAEMAAVPVLSVTPKPTPGVVPKTAQPTNSEPSPSTTPQEGIQHGFVIHLSCFALDSAQTQLLEEKIRALTLPVYHKAIQNGAHKFTCVFSGPYPDRSKADAAASTIQNKGGVATPLVKRYSRELP